MLKYWLQLAARSGSDPRGVFAEIRKRGHSLTDVAIAAALVSALGVIFFELSVIVAPVEGGGNLFGITSPLAGFLFQYIVILLTAVVIYLGGRLFGGTGDLPDSLLAVTWLQFIMLMVQVFQMVAFLLIPPVGTLIFLAAIVLLMYLMVNFIMELHGFKSAMAVAAGVIGGLFALALFLSILMALLGVGLGGVVENV